MDPGPRSWGIVTAPVLRPGGRQRWLARQDAWAKGLDYSRLPLDLSRRVYEAVRAAVIYYAGEHYERSGHLEFVHSVTGLRTLKDEFDDVASHNARHLDQIRAALGESVPR